MGFSVAENKCCLLFAILYSDFLIYAFGFDAIMVSRIGWSLDTHSLAIFSMNAPAVERSLFFWALLISFAAKLPVTPLHLWLPEAHVEAPLLVACCLLVYCWKLVGLVFINFFYLTFLTAYWTQCLIANYRRTTAIYGFLGALVQIDIKKIMLIPLLGTWLSFWFLYVQCPSREFKAAFLLW